jgi:hypothetical protein
MRQQRAYSMPQAYAYTPRKDRLQRQQTCLTPGRASKCVSFVLGLALGTGMAVLLSLLSTWFLPSTPATAASVTSDEQAQIWTLSSSEMADSGLSSAFFVNPSARLKHPSNNGR